MLTRNQQILLLLIFLIAIYFIQKINNLEKKNIENFIITDADIQTINTSVKKIYLADVEAIRILSNFAIQLSQGGTIIDNNINFTGTVTTDNIIGNITTTGNINTDSINANRINLTSNITTPNINLTGDLNTNSNLSNITTNNINVGGNINMNNTNIVLNNKPNLQNRWNINVPNDNTKNMMIARWDNTILTEDKWKWNSGFKFNASTSTLTCNEIKYNKISGNSSVGAWLISAEKIEENETKGKGSNVKKKYYYRTKGSFPIYYSISNYDDYYMNENYGYIIMPGYKLIIYLETNYSSPLRTFENTSTLPTKIELSVSNSNYTGPLSDNLKQSNSCRLYYGNTLISEPSNSIVTIS